jgi:hypothetical protein
VMIDILYIILPSGLVVPSHLEHLTGHKGQVSHITVVSFWIFHSVFVLSRSWFVQKTSGKTAL